MFSIFSSQMLLQMKQSTTQTLQQTFTPQSKFEQLYNLREGNTREKKQERERNGQPVKSGNGHQEC